MCFIYIIAVILVIIAIYVVYENQHVKNTESNKTVSAVGTDKIEGFYPRRWWWGGHNGGRWGWRRPYYNSYGNWRPYGYYPAYSGYWKQCPSGTWCPQNISCLSPACY